MFALSSKSPTRRTKAVGSCGLAAAGRFVYGQPFEAVCRGSSHGPSVVAGRCRRKAPEGFGAIGRITRARTGDTTRYNTLANSIRLESTLSSHEVQHLDLGSQTPPPRTGGEGRCDLRIEASREGEEVSRRVRTAVSWGSAPRQGRCQRPRFQWIMALCREHTTGSGLRPRSAPSSGVGAPFGTTGEGWCSTECPPSNWNGSWTALAFRRTNSPEYGRTGMTTRQLFGRNPAAKDKKYSNVVELWPGYLSGYL